MKEKDFKPDTLGVFAQRGARTAMARIMLRRDMLPSDVAKNCNLSLYHVYRIMERMRKEKQKALDPREYSIRAAGFAPLIVELPRFISLGIRVEGA